MSDGEWKDLYMLVHRVRILATEPNKASLFYNMVGVTVGSCLLLYNSTLFFVSLAFVHIPVDHFCPPTFACQPLRIWSMQQQLLIDDLPDHHRHGTNRSPSLTVQVVQ
jgi:hypothetical protein